MCDICSVANTFLKLLSVVHLYVLFYYTFLTVSIVKVDMLKVINFNSGLSIYGTVVFSDHNHRWTVVHQCYRRHRNPM